MNTDDTDDHGLRAYEEEIPGFRRALTALAILGALGLQWIPVRAYLRAGGIVGATPQELVLELWGFVALVVLGLCAGIALMIGMALALSYTLDRLLAWLVASAPGSWDDEPVVYDLSRFDPARDGRAQEPPPGTTAGGGSH